MGVERDDDCSEETRVVCTCFTTAAQSGEVVVKDRVCGLKPPCPPVNLGIYHHLCGMRLGGMESGGHVNRTTWNLFTEYWWRCKVSE